MSDPPGAPRNRTISPQQPAPHTLHELILENLNDAVIILDASFTIQYWNHGAEELYGWTAAEVVGRPMGQILQTDYLDAGDDHAAFVMLQDRGAWRDEVVQHHRDGRELYIDASVRMLRGDQGEVIAMIGINRDISARKRAEAALEQSESKYRTLVEHLPLVIYRADFVDVNSTSYISPQIEALLGYTQEEWCSDPTFWISRLHPDDRERVLAEQRRFQATGIPRPIEHRMLARDGQIVWVHDEAVVLRGEHGHPLALLGITQDITEQKRMEAQLLQSQKMESIGRLAGGIAHDFNNLLTAINGYVSLAYESLPAEHPIREDLREAHKATERATTLTRQLLTFARKQALDQRVLSLNDLIRDADSLLRRLIGEDIEIETRLAPNLSLVQADPGQIQQVLINLAVNARDAMPQGGRLTLETANLDQHEAGDSRGAGRLVRLAVRDTGVGIAPEVQAHLFEPFFTTKPTGQGTGLGLATCYGIVEQHGGSISAESIAGQGASFTIYLPAAAEDRAERPAQHAPSQLPRGSETVLLVEDEAAVRAFVAQALRGLGYSVLEAGDGAAALRLAAAQPDLAIDLLLTDVVMPQLGGVALATALIAERPQLKVIYMSGYADSATMRADRLPAGFVFLPKPFTAAVLAHKLRALLDA